MGFVRVLLSFLLLSLPLLAFPAEESAAPPRSFHTYGRPSLGRSPARTPHLPKQDGLMDGFHTQVIRATSSSIDGSPTHQVIRATSQNFSSSTCKPTYGVLPCTHTIIGNIFLLLVYGFIVFTAARFLAQGSELLLLLLDSNIVGGLLLPLFGVLPDSILVLVTGTGGSQIEAQEEVLVGIGLIAGSNVMLLTLLWGLCLILGRSDLEKQSDGKVHVIDKQLTRKFDLLGTGIEIDKETRLSAGIMSASIIPLLAVQIPHIFHATKKKSISVLIACILSFGGLVIYCSYQVLSPTCKKRKQRKAFHDLITFNILKFSQEDGKLVGEGGKVNKDVLNRVFDRLDTDKDDKLTRDEVRVMLTMATFKEKLNEQVVEHFMNIFDTDKNDTISREEFLEEMDKSCKNMRPTHSLSLPPFKPEKFQQIIEDMVEIEGEPTTLTKSQLIRKSLILLLGGVLLVGIFAEPLVDAVTDFSHASRIPSFFVSFVLLPIASNASEAISSIIFASRKQKVNLSLTYSQIYGAVTMNNTMSLGILLAIIYARRLEWNFSSEVLIICLVVLIMGIVSMTQRILRLWLAFLVLLLYPLAIAIVSILDYLVGWT